MTAVAPHRVVSSRIAAAAEVGRELSAAAVVLSSAPAVRWLGVQRPAGVLALVSAGEALLVAPAGAELDATESVELYTPGEVAAGLRRALGRIDISPDDRVALEPRALPLEVAASLAGRRWVDAGAALGQARAGKDPDELELVVAATRLADIGQGTLRDAARAGATELELWGIARGAIEAVKGRPLHAIVDLMAGDRTECVGLPPSTATVEADAPVLFDLAPRHDGYWADSCATIVCGAPSAAVRRLHDAARAALEVGIANARAGVHARDLDALVRARLAKAGFDCPHHVGHGVGAAPQEEPWLSPDATLTLDEGTVVALEPGVYRDGVGVRVEHLLVVEAGGARPLTTHSLSLT